MDGTVHVVDDDRSARQSLAWLLESAGFEVAEYACAEDFLQAFDDELPGCLVLDVRMPGMGGMELQAMLCRRSAQIPIIFVTGHGDVAAAVTAIRNGAFDFLEKPFDDGEILVDVVTAALLASHSGLERRRAQEGLRTKIGRLTQGERQVWSLMVAGRQNKEIADALSISIKTVEARRKNVLTKLETRSPVELAGLARLAAKAGVG